MHTMYRRPVIRRPRPPKAKHLFVTGREKERRYQGLAQ